MIYFSGNYYEQDKNFPDLFFQASFIIDEEGKMILNYRNFSIFAGTTESKSSHAGGGPAAHAVADRGAGHRAAGGAHRGARVAHDHRGRQDDHQADAPGQKVALLGHGHGGQPAGARSSYLP